MAVENLKILKQLYKVWNELETAVYDLGVGWFKLFKIRFKWYKKQNISNNNNIISTIIITMTAKL